MKTSSCPELPRAVPNGAVDLLQHRISQHRRRSRRMEGSPRHWPQERGGVQAYRRVVVSRAGVSKEQNCGEDGARSVPYLTCSSGPLRHLTLADNQPCTPYHGMWSWVEGIPNPIVGCADVGTRRAEREIGCWLRWITNKSKMQQTPVTRVSVRARDQADKRCTATNHQLNNSGRPGRRPSVMRSSHAVLVLGWGK